MKNPAPTLTRTTFQQSRLLDFCSRKELTAQTGHAEQDWPLVVLKELTDNALDACEDAGTAPAVSVVVDDAGIEVSDNGPGLPASTLDGVLDFSIRVSNREAYVAPDRGAQGNALKTIVAMPYVLDGSEGHVEVTAHGVRHRITLRVDRIRQEPVIHRDSAAADGKEGTSIRVFWPAATGCDLPSVKDRFLQLASDYTVLNPHLTLAVDFFGERLALPTTMPDWPKWRPSDPTSPHWYMTEHLGRLVAAYLAHDADSGRHRTVREFVTEFRGLTGTAKQKAVLEASGLWRAPLADLTAGDAIDDVKVAALLAAMQGQSRPVKPDALGIIGRDHLAARLAAFGVVDESFDYRRVTGEDDGRPYVVEAAFGWLGDDAEDKRRLITGANWSPGIVNPFRVFGDGWGLDATLAANHAGPWEPVVFVLHLAMPRMEYTDRGKSAVVTTGPLGRAMAEVVLGVVKKWTKQRKAEERKASARDRRAAAFTYREDTWVDAAEEYMDAAYEKASSGGKYTAAARQVMYAFRLLTQEMMAGKELQSAHFTQRLLPDYMARYPRHTEDWKVAWDARGRLREPHTDRLVPLGGMEVSAYLAAKTARPRLGIPRLSSAWPTVGPTDRFSAILFIEKEGFNEQLAEARIAQRYDVAIASTKGMSVTAIRALIDRLAVPVYVLHDFDQAGFSILGTLRRSSRRYTFRRHVEVVDLGLRLQDIETYGLLSERQRVTHDVETLLRNGATVDDVTYLLSGQRVELNAFDAATFMEYIAMRLDEVGVEKVVPDDDRLEAEYRHAYRTALLQRAVAAAYKPAVRTARAVDVPDDLLERIEDGLRADPEKPWDAVVADIVKEDMAP